MKTLKYLILSVLAATIVAQGENDTEPDNPLPESGTTEGTTDGAPEGAPEGTPEETNEGTPEETTGETTDETTGEGENSQSEETDTVPGIITNYGYCGDKTECYCKMQSEYEVPMPEPWTVPFFGTNFCHTISIDSPTCCNSWQDETVRDTWMSTFPTKCMTTQTNNAYTFILKDLLCLGCHTA